MHGPDSPEVAMRVKRLFMIFRFDTALLLLIVVNMAASRALRRPLLRGIVGDRRWNAPRMRAGRADRW